MDDTGHGESVLGGRPGGKLSIGFLMVGRCQGKLYRGGIAPIRSRLVSRVLT